MTNMEWMPWGSVFFGKLSQYPPVIGKDDQSILEKFVVTMYDRSSATDSIDVARLELLSRKQRSYDVIPPTQAALIQHNKRAVYQAGCIWGQATICQMETNSPADWGWKKQGDMCQIFWTALPPIAQSCQELTKCDCKTECRGRCKCYRFSLPCTALCSCNCDG